MITLVFFIFVGGKNVVTSDVDYNVKFNDLSSDDVLRTCVLAENETCATSAIDKYLPGIYSYEVDVHDNESISISDKRIYVKSHFFSGNLTEYRAVKLDVYYWIG